MRQIVCRVVIAVVVGGAALGAQEPQAAPAAPAPGSPATYKSAKELAEVRWLAPGR